MIDPFLALGTLGAPLRHYTLSEVVNMLVEDDPSLAALKKSGKNWEYPDSIVKGIDKKLSLIHI